MERLLKLQGANPDKYQKVGIEIKLRKLGKNPNAVLMFRTGRNAEKIIKKGKTIDIGFTGLQNAFDKIKGSGTSMWKRKTNDRNVKNLI